MKIDPKVAAEIWLLSATAGLCADAKEQISKEVKEHVAEAFDSEVVKGADEFSAINTVLQDLGDARKANRQYRKIYLTANEATWLENGFWPCPSLFLRICISVICLLNVLLAAVIFVNRGTDKELNSIFLFSAIGSIILFLITTGLPWGIGKQRPRLMILSTRIGFALYGVSQIIMFMVAIPLTSRFSLLFVAVFISFIAVDAIKSQRLLRKIENRDRIATR